MDQTNKADFGLEDSVPEMKEHAASLPYVVFADDNLYTCYQDAQERINEKVRVYNLNQVVASCSPRTHEPLFQGTHIAVARAASFNPLYKLSLTRSHEALVIRGRGC